MTMFNRFTDRAKRVIIMAREEAARLNHGYIGTEHLLLGLCKMGEGVAVTTLQSFSMDLDTIRMEVEKLIQPGPGTMTVGEIPFTPAAKKVIDLAMDECRTLGHNYIAMEHILLGLIREGEGVGSRVLIGMGLELKKVRARVLEILGEATGGGVPSPSSAATATHKSRTPALDAFGRDLTLLAREEKLDPVIGREEEIDRVIQVLSRRTKNNPVLLGEAGVGKTAIVEGLAQKIVAGDVPEVLRDKRLVTLDLALMVAGTKYRGQFEERMKQVMAEIRRADDVLIFIDELHTLVGAGAAEGAIDASNMLKPALSRGEVQCIGATTLDEYRKHIEKDAALERRFQPIMVDPPNVEETVQILRGLRDRFEAHHRCRFSDEALVAAARLADRYISGRFLPDKAIDVIDEAGAKARLAVNTIPPDIREVEERIEELVKEKESSIKAQEFEQAAELRDKIRGAEEELQEAKRKWRRKQDQEIVEVDENLVAEIVSKWTGVPVTKLEERETDKLLRMEDELRQYVVGQDQAIAALARAVRRSRAGLKDPKRPIGSFIFVGPTGVGKTELAKQLARFMFGDEDALIRVDMSEYMERFAVSRLVGAPPGYVGYEEGGQLTERVRRRPYSVVLLDELEKANQEIFNILLQVLEDGRLTDSLGRTVDFRNAVLIMTSNVGTGEIKSGGMGFAAADEQAGYDSMRERLLGKLKERFRPEFLNRIDEVIVFRNLDEINLKAIIDILLRELSDRLLEENRNLSVTDEAKRFIIEKGCGDLNYGARPLKRALQRFVEDPLSEEILRGRFKQGSGIIVDAGESGITFREDGD